MDFPVHGRSKSARWVCPNDRQLALRAKLRTGWSVKSASLDSRYTDYSQCSSSCPGSLSSTSSHSANVPLSDEERQRIIEVIQRAEALDQSEQERVGKLVERLENMKRNVSVVTSGRSSGQTCGSRCIRGNRCVCCCALCGEKFTVLGAGPTLCQDCRKYVCQKCGIETTTNNIIKTTQTGTTAAAAAAKNLHSSLRRKTGGSISNFSSLESLSNSNQQPVTPTKVFLCRICTETREMWKKSGAWFFKSLPKYILPEKKKGRSGTRNSTWAVSGTRSLEPPEQDSSSDEDASSRRAGSRQRLRLSQSLSTEATERILPKFESIQVEVHKSPSESTSHTQLLVPSTSLASTSPTSPLSPASLTPSRSSSRLRDYQKDKSPINQQQSNQSVFFVRFPSASSSESVDRDSSVHDNSIRKTSRERNSFGSEASESSRQLTTTTATATGSRRPSINSDVSSIETDLSGTLYNKRDQDPSQQLASYSHHRQMESTNSNNSSVSGMDEKKNLGTLEMTIRYDPSALCLQCKVERARGLRPMDIHGLADPFCMLNILPIGANTTSTTTKRLKTKTVHKTRDPEFNELLNFYGITENDLKSEKALHVMILQDDPAGRDFLGEAKFPLRELQPCQTKYYNVFLEDHYQVDQEEIVWGEDMTNGRGQIYLTLSYCTRRRALLVCVERASNLLAMDSNGLSDPFVKLTLISEPTDDSHKNLSTKSVKHHQTKQKKTQGTLTHTTKVKWKTLNPVWNEEFAFETRLTDLAALALVLSVWDKDFGKKNDFLGGLVISCNSTGARLRHWIDVIKFPDHRHQGFHELTKHKSAIRQ